MKTIHLRVTSHLHLLQLVRSPYCYQKKHHHNGPIWTRNYFLPKLWIDPDLLQSLRRQPEYKLQWLIQKRFSDISSMSSLAPLTRRSSTAISGFAYEAPRHTGSSKGLERQASRELQSGSRPVQDLRFWQCWSPSPNSHSVGSGMRFRSSTASGPPERKMHASFPTNKATTFPWKMYLFPPRSSLSKSYTLEEGDASTSASLLLFWLVARCSWFSAPN
jgi:hypothetical protein